MTSIASVTSSLDLTVNSTNSRPRCWGRVPFEIGAIMLMGGVSKPPSKGGQNCAE